jgi:two-component sensor histidine kinase
MSAQLALQETTDERTIRILSDEIAQLRQQIIGQASEHRFDLEAAMRSAELRINERGELLHEVNHRAKNSIQIAISLLSLQMHATANDEVRLALASAVRRLGHVATAHMMLNSHSADEQTIDFREYLITLSQEMHLALGDDKIQLVVESDELVLDTSRAVNLALIVGEALTNAMKYAFPNGRAGTIKVECRHDGGQASMTVTDDGVGLPEKVRPGSLGMRLIETLGKGLSGVSKIDNFNGTRVVVTFPVETHPAGTV